MITAPNASIALPEATADALLRPLDALFDSLEGFFARDTSRVARRAPRVGVVEEMRLASDPAQRYFLFIPRGDSARRRIFVAIHGISRNADEHAAEFSRLAERHGLVIVAPLFDETRFPDYQRLGRSGKGERADLMLDRIVAEVAQLSGTDGTRFHLFGYSGGGQFAHRYALAHPERVVAYAIGAAGWYTLPDAAQKYPLGIRSTERLPDLAFDPRRFLAIPAAVFVGDRDVHDGTALRQSERLRAEQGENRHERGRTWIDAMTHAARSLAMETEFHFESLPRSPHCFLKSMRRGGLGERVVAWMFDRPQEVRPPLCGDVTLSLVPAFTAERIAPKAILSCKANGDPATGATMRASPAGASRIRTCAAGPP